MITHRDFLKSTILGAGALSLTPCFSAFGAASPGNGFPKRFVFIRKSNGEHPHDVALPSLPEGKGNMFDNTMIMYFPEGGEKHHAPGDEAPFVIMAGNNCSLDMAGRYIRLHFHGTEGHKTLGNWYTTLLNAHGNPIKHYGDLDVGLNKFQSDQTGPIRRFLS